MKLKATESSVNTGSAVGLVFVDSFLVKRYLTETEMETMAKTCIDIEDTQ